jgi:hypothetical protein
MSGASCAVEIARPLIRRVFVVACNEKRPFWVVPGAFLLRITRSLRLVGLYFETLKIERGSH